RFSEELTLELLRKRYRGFFERGGTNDQREYRTQKWEEFSHRVQGSGSELFSEFRFPFVPFFGGHGIHMSVLPSITQKKGLSRRSFKAQAKLGRYFEANSVFDGDPERNPVQLQNIEGKFH